MRVKVKSSKEREHVEECAFSETATHGRGCSLVAVPSLPVQIKNFNTPFPRLSNNLAKETFAQTWLAIFFHSWEEQQVIET